MDSATTAPASAIRSRHGGCELGTGALADDLTAAPRAPASGGAPRPARGAARGGSSSLMTPSMGYGSRRGRWPGSGRRESLRGRRPSVARPAACRLLARLRGEVSAVTVLHRRRRWGHADGGDAGWPSGWVYSVDPFKPAASTTETHSATPFRWSPAATRSVPVRAASPAGRRPSPSNQSTFTMSPRRPRKTKTWPDEGVPRPPRLDLSTQPMEAAAHVGHARRDPDPCSCRECNHERRLFSTARTIAASTLPSRLTRI